MATLAKTGVYWPYKTLLEGAGISFQEDSNTVRIVATGGGTGGGGGDMLKSDYAPSGLSGIVDHALLADTATNVTHASQADHVPWTGITGIPANFPTDWTYIANKPTVFPTSWDLIVGRPAVFPPEQHGSRHTSTGTDPIPLSAVGIGGLLAPLSGQPTDYLNGTGVFADFATNVATTALQRSGDTLALGAMLTGKVDVPTDQTGYSLAPFLADSASVGGFGAIGMHCQGYWGCALGASQTGLCIATTSGPAVSFVQLTDQTGHIVGSALAAGAAVINLGYTPINGSAGGSYAPTNPVVFAKDVGLAAASYSLAPLRVSNLTSAGRPQIGFLVQGVVGASLYLETDSTFRFINSAGTVARLHDTLHKLAGGDLAAGAAVANIGFTPVNKAGDSLLNAMIVMSKDVFPVTANSWGTCALQIASASASGGKACIGLINSGRVGITLYCDDDGRLKYYCNGVIRNILTNP
jgi:hypothetical protein